MSKKKDIWNTTLNMRQYLYEWLVIPFSLCNVLTTFMHLMDVIFHPFLNSFVIKYLYDILVYISNYKYHISHLMQVLDTWVSINYKKTLRNVNFPSRHLCIWGMQLVEGNSKLILQRWSPSWNGKIILITLKLLYLCG